MYYSKSTGAFLDSPENYQNFPEDAVEISDELYAEVMLNKPPGKIVVSDPDGLPMLADPPPPTSEQLSSAALGKRDHLLKLAAIRIAPLQDAVDLGNSTPEEYAALTKWKQYRVDVNRINKQPGFPTLIDWPTSPSEED